jgi:hypothetical protein
VGAAASSSSRRRPRRWSGGPFGVVSDALGVEGALDGERAEISALLRGGGGAGSGVLGKSAVLGVRVVEFALE